MTRTLTARDIERLLANKHTDDVFVSQCKDGASYGQGLLILDGWAMKKSWANPCATGYEIKVSRSDFSRDDKWRGYLAYCNEFYFVCPAGMLKPEEIPAPAGLMTVSSTGTILFKKKKAEWRDVIIPDSIFRYILYTRAKISRESSSANKRLYWENWLREKKIDRNFGWEVKGAIRNEVKKRILEVEEENKRIRDQNRKYEDVKNILSNLGFKADKYFSTFEVERKVEDLRKAIPPELEVALHSLKSTLDRFQDSLRNIEKKFSPEVPAIAEVDE